MELVTEPELYSPIIDDNGNYIDKIPYPFILKKGIQCPCGSRTDKIYNTYSMFSAHIKTKHHQKWLAGMNTNKANYYIENESLKQTVQNQRLIIANLEKEIQKKVMTIDYLALQLSQYHKNANTTIDLMNFD